MTTGQTVALATASRLPSGMEDTNGLVEAFRQAGASSELVVWSDPAVAWEQYSVALLHSPWDYSERVNEFLAWVAANGKNGWMVNSKRLIEWNVDKRYLLQLEQQGVPLPLTLVGTSGRSVSTAEVVDTFGGARIVVKPVVSAGGRRIWRCESTEHARAILLQEVPDEPVLVQEYESSVETIGEYSAIFLGGQLSHAVRKTPKPGEFRVQSHYGGRAEPVGNLRWMDSYGKQVLSKLPEVPGYARVDFVMDRANDPKLIELELIEPDLFLRYAPQSCNRLVEVMLRR